MATAERSCCVLAYSTRLTLPGAGMAGMEMMPGMPGMMMMPGMMPFGMPGAGPGGEREGRRGEGEGEKGSRGKEGQRPGRSAA